LTLNKITDAFDGKKALITFITGGDPDVETTERLIYALEEAGADIIEIGIPFSDPIAEGIVIQQADERALSAGCTTDKLFDMVKTVRTRTNIPLLFMTYINPIFTYEKNRFMTRCKECGVDGVIVPDLPFEEN
jgi:tryptophan synthase alpha chain